MTDVFLRSLRRGLACIDRDAPACAAAMRAALGSDVIAFEVDGHHSWLAAGTHWRTRSGRAPSAQVELRTARSELGRLARGDLQLADALFEGRLEVSASPERAAALFDALSAFIEGCARSPWGPQILAEFSAESTEERT